MSEEMIDIEALKKAKPAGRRPFLKFKPPEGKTFYAYRIKFLSEPREVISKRWIDPKTGEPRREQHADVELVIAVNDNDVEAGKQYRINISANLMRQLDAFKPLTDKVFDVMNRGKPKGKTYYDYAVLPQEGTLSIERLLK